MISEDWLNLNIKCSILFCRYRGHFYWFCLYEAYSRCKRRHLKG